MNIGGFQKNSLIDFPKTIACLIFTQGCNFVCPYCHNPDLVTGPQKRTGDLYDENQIFKFLEKRKGLLEGVVITGGEPTLQKDLTAFCRTVKNMGYTVKLDSNGTHPEMLTELLENRLVDFISMDIKTSLDKYNLVVPGAFDAGKILESIRILMKTAPAYEFRTTCTRPFISTKTVKEIGNMVRGASTYILQKCSRNVSVLDPEFLKKDDHFFTEKKIMEFQAILDQFVETSIIR